ncbi:IS200/IS605 family transposase [Vibrio fluvialis]|nr:IS200/IS605 family transposase [Vibrio fluvialis]MBY8191380.1 IS200/IS605 family transposase [Vibrio fluvialis]
MSRYDSSSHVYYRCQYHIVWTPKYRLKILKGNIAKELYKSIYIYSHMKNCKVVELNVQIDHVHLVVRLPPSLSISGYFVDSVGMNEEIIRRYVRHQDRVGKEEEERQMLLGLES